MSTVQEYAWAKLNLTLDVTGRMADGYHSVATVMQTVTLRDDVQVALTETGEVTARSNISFLPADERNIAVKAARLFLRTIGRPDLGAEITMEKRIPIGAGMGGGSTDGAAVLRALNRLTGAGMSAEQLETLARELGSDVPFCVRGGTALGTGRGDVLTPLPPLPDCHLVIAKPAFSISTPTLYAQIDGVRRRCHPDTDGVTSALAAGDLRGVALRLFNVFEGVLPRKFSQVLALRSQLLDLGALGAVMTGTGSAVFGLFDGETSADAARGQLAREYDTCVLCRPQPALPV